VDADGNFDLQSTFGINMNNLPRKTMLQNDCQMRLAPRST